jgi:hypothetical protein
MLGAHNYSGGARYRTRLPLTGEEAKAKVMLDLGKVAGTAEVHVNGKLAGIKVAPPWRLDVTGLLKEGENNIEVLVYNSLANHYQTIPSRYRGNPLSGLLGPVRLSSRDWPKGEAVLDGLLLSADGAVRISVATGSPADFDSRIGSAGNLLLRPGLLKSATGTRAHDGGGGEFSALFNGAAGNKNGGEDTANDGATFVGMQEGNILELLIDSAKAPAGVPVYAIRTYSGHADARASQHYTVFAATAAAPDQFVKLAEVDCDSPGGLNEISIETAKRTAIMEGVRSLRFVFKNGSLGFNLYREIAVLDKPLSQNQAKK